MTSEGFSGVRFGPYTLHTLLGKGASAKVFMATYGDDPSRVVALKVLHGDLSEEDDQLTRLKDEAQLGEWMNHPNIVAVRDLKRVGRYWCLEMEFVDGFTLEELLYREDEVRGGKRIKHRRFSDRIPPSVVIDIMLQACRGLEHAHSVTAHSTDGIGLIHRDIKPANIIVTRDGSVKIMDFGIATFVQALRESNKTMDGTVRGSPSYMSPEQVTGKTVTKQTDLFSLGTVLAEILLCGPVFNADGVHEIMRMIATQASAYSSRRVYKVAPEFTPLIHDLHAKDPERRYETATSFVHALEALKIIVSGPSLRDWIRTSKSRLPGSKPLNEWGSDGRPEEVLRLDDLRRTGMFSGFGKAKAVTREIVVVTSEVDGDDDDDEDIRPTVQDLVAWSTSHDVQPIGSTEQLATPRAGAGAPVSIGSADFQAETADWSSLKPESDPKTDDWSTIPDDESDTMSELMDDTEEVDEEAHEEPRPGKVSLILMFLPFFIVAGAFFILISTSSDEPHMLTEPTPVPDLELPASEVIIEPMSVTPVLTPISIPAPTPRPTPLVEREMPIVEPRRPLIQEVVPSPAPEPSGTVEYATLTIMTTPESVVYLDGEKIGSTPLIDHSVTAGAHKLRLECIGSKCPEGGGVIRLNIDPSPGESVPRLLKFESPLQ